MQVDGFIPRALLDRPQLTSRQQTFYGIYSELARSRPIVQGGALPIPIDKLEGYVNYFRIHNMDEREEIFLYVSHLDEVYLVHANKAMQEATKAPVR